MTEGEYIRPETAASERAEGVYGELAGAVKKLEQLTKNMKDHSNKELEKMTAEIEALMKRFTITEEPKKRK